MAVFDTHKAIKTLIGAGFSETKAEALIDAMGDSQEALATKADMAIVYAKLDALEHAVNERATKADLQEQELRMRLQLYAVAIVVIGVLTALELIPR